MFNKISSAISYSLESTYLGRGIKKVFTNLANFIYHIGCAAKHLIVGVASAVLILAKCIIGCAIGILTVNLTVLTGSALVLYSSLKNAFFELKDGVFACGKSIFTAVKSLAGFQDPVEEVLNVGEQSELLEELPITQEESQLILAEEVIKKGIENGIKSIFEEVDKISKIEEEHKDRDQEINMIVDTYEEGIKNSLFTMYKAGKEVVSLVFTPLRQQQQLADNSSRMRIEEVEQDSHRIGLTLH